MRVDDTGFAEVARFKPSGGAETVVTLAPPSSRRCRRLRVKVGASCGFHPSYTQCASPDPASITQIKGYPSKIIIYLCPASSYWQIRYFSGGKPQPHNKVSGSWYAGT
jgi:hypothetical protein